MSIIKVIKGKAIPIHGDDIDTDRIIPARFLKEISFENMGHYLFYDVRFEADKTPKPHVLNETRYLGASIMIEDVTLDVYLQENMPLNPFIALELMH